ncbi:MAG: hypothetical protein WC551_02560 [Patescibacteria group bacterium]
MSQNTDKLIRKVKRLKKDLLLTDWRVEISFSLTPHEEDGDYTTFAKTTPDDVYKLAQMVIYPAFWQQDSQDQLLLHEMLHILAAPMERIARSLRNGCLHTEEEIDQANERLTTHLEHIISGMKERQHGHAGKKTR